MSRLDDTLIYKIVDRASWREARHQLERTAAKHFAGQTDLVLVAVDPAALGDALRWEPSRGGDLFPHLYGPLAMDAVLWQIDLPFDGARHVFPEGEG